MMGVSWEWRGAAEAAAGVAAQRAAIDRGIRRAVVDTARRLVEQTQANASGRPGPNVITGVYRSSWFTDELVGSGEAAAVVATDEPYARRLERGFYGVDSLGRHYNQPPFPHLGPAVETVGPQFEQAVRDVISGAT